jgi:protoheme ferro-lyase
VEARAWAAELGLTFTRVPALNLSPRFIDALAGLVERAVHGVR